MKSEFPSVNMMVTFGRRSTQAQILLYYTNEDASTNHILATSGEAIRHPDDKPSENIGRELALGRALESMGRKLIKRANGRVKHADDIRGPSDHREIEEMVRLTAAAIGNVEEAREHVRFMRDALGLDK